MHNQKNILLKGVTWKLLLFFSNFLLNIFLANVLGATGSGSFLYIINNLTFTIQLLGLGLDTSLGYFNSKKEHALSYLINVAISWSILTTIIFTSIFYLGLSLKVFEYNNNPYLLVLFVFTSLLNGLISTLYISSNRNLLPSLIPTFINFLLIVYLFLLSINNQQAFVWDLFLNAYLLAPLFVCLILFSIIFYKEKVKFKFQPIGLRNKLLTYSLQIFIFNISISLLLRSDIWLVKFLSNAKDFGNYIQTGKVVQLVLLLPNLASFVLLPMLTKQKSKGVMIEENVLKLSNIYFFGSLLICVFLSTTGFWLFPFAFGSSFSKMYYIFILLMPGILFFSASYPIDSYFSSIDKNSENIKGAFYSLLVMLTIDLLLIPNYSIYGAAVGSTIAYAFFFYFLVRRFKRYYSFSLTKIFNFRLFLRNFLLTFKLK